MSKSTDIVEKATTDLRTVDGKVQQKWIVTTKEESLEDWRPLPEADYRGNLYRSIRLQMWEPCGAVVTSQYNAGGLATRQLTKDFIPTTLSIGGSDDEILYKLVRHAAVLLCTSAKGLDEKRLFELIGMFTLPPSPESIRVWSQDVPGGLVREEKL